MVLDGTNVDQWQWQAGTYEILFASVSAIRRRLALALEVPVAHPIAFEANVSATSAGARLATAAVSFMMSAYSPETSMAAATAASLQDMILSIFLEGFPPKQLARKPSGPSPRHIRSAVEFIHTHARDVISVEEIANAAGTSVRTLQVGFAETREGGAVARPSRVFRQGLLCGYAQ